MFEKYRNFMWSIYFIDWNANKVKQEEEFWCFFLYVVYPESLVLANLFYNYETTCSLVFVLFRFLYENLVIG
jgi:hypothetical protein